MPSFAALFATIFLMTAALVGGPATDAYAQSCGSCGNNNVQSGEECDDGGCVGGDGCSATCTVESGYDCIGNPSVCTLIVCGNGITQAGEDCDGGPCCNGDCTFTAASTVCRASTGVCDPAEVCSGAASTCPANVLSTSVCRGAAGVCDVAESCDGTNGACPADAKSTALCRAASGVCDAGPETCDGSSNDCPADVPANSGTLCRGSAGVCDVAEFCDGISGACPADAKSTALCRASAGECDLAESCNGTSNTCPADAKSTAVCREAVNPACDVAESCNGASNNCPDDVLFNCGDDDGIACTEATCLASGECAVADTCVEICRGAGFWSTHSGYEKDSDNVGQNVLDEVGSLTVCGVEVDETANLGDLDSALEGLCVRTQGVKERQLYRQLLTAALNCAISEGGTCQQITERFIEVSYDDCDALCEGNPVVDGPTLKQCKDQLACFNGGGRVIDGDCAKGTCAEDTETYCGGNYGDCPDIGDQPQDCVPFEDTCRKVDLCSEDLDAPAQICPDHSPANSPKTCKEARRNDCTIDSCP